MAVMTLLLFDIAPVRLARDQPLLLYSIVPFAVLSNGFLPTLVEPFQLAFVACGQSVVRLTGWSTRARLDFFLDFTILIEINFE